MAFSPDNVSMALFCDFENVALGVREANHEKFDIRPILERLLLKGNIAVKKAYCDWERYKGFKAIMHEANFELIEIPHVRQSGKNSADIRLVVDALDLCYTKSHVNTFVIISGDSDFSPLVSKLRENAKQVIGVGVKHSTSDLLVANCDEFIFYDDLLKAGASQPSHQVHRDPLRHEGTPAETGGEAHHADKPQALKDIAIGMAVETFDALLSERGDSGKIWASTLKQAIKRRKPDFNESHYGFRAFGSLLEEAQSRGLLTIGRDEKSGTYVYRADADRASDHTTTGKSAATINPGLKPVETSSQLPESDALAGATTGRAKTRNATRPRADGRSRRLKNKSDGTPPFTPAEAVTSAHAAPLATDIDTGSDSGHAAKTSAQPSPTAQKPARTRGKRPAGGPDSQR